CVDDRASRYGDGQSRPPSALPRSVGPLFHRRIPLRVGPVPGRGASDVRTLAHGHRLEAEHFAGGARDPVSLSPQRLTLVRVLLARPARAPILPRSLQTAPSAPPGDRGGDRVGAARATGDAPRRFVGAGRPWVQAPASRHATRPAERRAPGTGPCTGA